MSVQTGQVGRVSLISAVNLNEPAALSEAFKDKVSREPHMESLRLQAVKDGMRPLRLAGAARIAEGLTTIDEVLATTPPIQ